MIEILFELRQKPFELPNTTEDYSLYKLCRIWLHGKDYSSNYGDFTPRSSPQKTAGDTTSEKNGKVVFLHLENIVQTNVFFNIR